MATWKKVIVSGSSPNFATVQVDNLTSGQVVIGGGTSNLSTTAINGTGNILATTGASGVVISGSFSGSFSGTAATASVAISSSYAVTSSLPLQGIITASVSISTITFTKGDQSTFSIVVSQSGSAQSSNAVSINNSSTGIWYPTFVVSGSSSQSLYVNSASFQYNAATNTLGVTSSYAATASYFITSSVTSASYAATASYFITSSVTSASYAATASYVNTLNQTVTISGSLLVSSSIVLTPSGSISVVSGSITALAFSGSHFGTSSWAQNALTASYFVTSSVTSASYAATASYVNTLNQQVNITGSLYLNSPNTTMGQFVGNQNGYVEFSVRNTNTGISASGDIVVYADTGTILDKYIDMGINNSGLTGSYYYAGANFGGALDAYMYSVGGNLRIGNANASSPSQSLFLFSNPVANPDVTITGSRVGIQKSGSLNATLDVLGSAIITGSLIVTQGITGSLLGTSSWALNFITSSVTSASYSATASYVVTALTASYFITSSVTSASYSATASFLTSSNIYGPYGSNSVLTASYAVTAAYAANGGTLLNSLTFGSGLSGSTTSFNGSTAVTVAVSGAVSLSTNNVPKWAGAGFVNSNITDTGTQIQVAAGASSGVSVAAGGVNVTGNSTFNNDVTVTGNFAVNGTTTFINTTNLYVKDQFVMINSGSAGLADAGLVAAYSASGVGSALYLETNTTGNYGRWAVAYDVSGSATTVTVDEYMVTAKIAQASAPSAAPTWGSGTNGTGNIWITNAGDIYIYS